MRKTYRLSLDPLEDLILPAPIVVVPQGNVTPLGGPALRHYYNADTIRDNGTGQTVAVIEAGQPNNFLNDFDTFASHYHFPLGNVSVVTPKGQTPPPVDTGWGLETLLDTEMIREMAPGAHILVVQAQSAFSFDLNAAAQYAASLKSVSVVSMSYGGADVGSLFDSTYTPTHRVAFLASAGDNGAGASSPASSAYVIAVGGTTTFASASGRYLGETAWSGSGGGIGLSPKPTYQTHYGRSGGRNIPDVSSVANPVPGLAVYDTDYGGWVEVGGTSASSPLWAALTAVADQTRARQGTAPLTTFDEETAIYTAPANNFHDITKGSNGNPATKGYDLVTGRGTPMESRLEPLLAKAKHVPTPPTTFHQGPVPNTLYTPL